jgi:hypothetical protein
LDVKANFKGGEQVKIAKVEQAVPTLKIHKSG